MVANKLCGSSVEPFSLLEFLIRDDCVEGMVPKRGGDSKTYEKSSRIH